MNHPRKRHLAKEKRSSFSLHCWQLKSISSPRSTRSRIPARSTHRTHRYEHASPSKNKHLSSLLWKGRIRCPHLFNVRSLKAFYLLDPKGRLHHSLSLFRLLACSQFESLVSTAGLALRWVSSHSSKTKRTHSRALEASESVQVFYRS